jgi:hypothetical protein
MSCCQRARDGRSIDLGSPRARNRFVRPSGQPLEALAGAIEPRSTAE